MVVEIELSGSFYLAQKLLNRLIPHAGAFFEANTEIEQMKRIPLLPELHRHWLTWRTGVTSHLHVLHAMQKLHGAHGHTGKYEKGGPLSV